MTFQFTDTMTIQGTRIRDDGYLVADAACARTGIQRYLGIECGRPELEFVDVYRPEEEVFSDEAMASFAHRPVTNDHPAEPVTKDNWKELAVGQTSDEVKKDNKFLRVPLMVADASAIEDVQNGKRELSAGYKCDLKFEKGTTSDGKTYDAIQTNIRANHVAIVDRGRAGKECRIGDTSEDWGIAPITTADRKETNMSNALQTVMVDGLSVQVTDQGAQAIAKLIADRDAVTTKLSDQKALHDKEMKEKEEEVAKKDAALDDAKSKILDANAISKLVADRVSLEATALKIAKDVKSTGLTDGELRLACVKAALGDKVAEDKLSDQAYVDARFDILAEDAAENKNDQFRDAMKGNKGSPNLNDAQAAKQAAFNGMVHFDQHGTELEVN